MNNEIDLLDELEREERDERFATNGGGAGAALGVVLTLLIGCGLVFAAYKLGQRKTVDEPPLIAANELPLKVAPVDPGGAPIPNTDNMANAMIDGSRPALAEGALRDGVIVEAGLPDRDIDQAAIQTADARDMMREVTQLSDLPMKPALEGEPSLSIDGPSDRSDEQRMVAGAEVVPAARPSLDELVAAAAADDADEAPNSPDMDDQPGASTTLAAAATDEADDASAPTLALTMRMPVMKPNVGPNAPRPLQTAEAETTPQLAPETRSPSAIVQRSRVEPAVAARVTPTPPTETRQAQAAPRGNTSGIQRVRIPPQPVGDAQVQLGAFPSPNEVRGRWAAIKARNPDLLNQLGLKVLPVRTSDGRQLFRMRVGPLRDTRQAAQLCQALAGRGVDCFVPAR